MRSKSPEYGMRVFWSDEDNAYVAVCTELPKVSAFGSTPALAVAELQVAIAAALEVYGEEGWPLPEPRRQEAFSGQLRVRLPRSLHARLAEAAEAEGVSLNTHIVSLLSAGAGSTTTVQHVARDLRKKHRAPTGKSVAAVVEDRRCRASIDEGEESWVAAKTAGEQVKTERAAECACSNKKRDLAVALRCWSIWWS